METEQRNKIRQNHARLVDDLNPRDILDDLCQDGILSQSDCEYIESDKSRKDKCRFLLFLLPRRGPSAYGSFLKSLTRNYDHLADLLRNPKQIKDIGAIEKIESVGPHRVNLANYTCRECKMFFPPFNVPDFGIFIKTNCCLIFKIVDPNDLLDLLYQEFVFGSDECERIRSGKTCSDRCAMFIFELAKCSDSQVESIFMRSLERKYGHITDKLKENAHLTTVLPRYKDKFKKRISPYPCCKESLAQPKRKKNHQRHSNHTKFKTCAIDIGQVTQTAVLAFSLRSILPREDMSKQLRALFNYLVPMINQGLYQKVKEHIQSFRRRESSKDPDIICLLDYLHASNNLFTLDVDSAEERIKKGLKRATKTSNPNYFTLELLTAQSRMYFIQRKLYKLKNTVDDAKMIVETKSVRYSSTVGYVFMNDAKLKSAQLEMLSVHRTNYHSVYEHLHYEAVSSCRRALGIFHRDEGIDGRFGLEFTMCRLAILLLRCGDNGLTMDVQRPGSEEIKIAGEFLQYIENSDLPIPKILKVPYHLAKSDFHYRKANSVKALEHAEEADRLAQEMQLEFSVPARNRVIFLKQMPVFVNAVDTEEASRLLFGDSLDSY